jgi:hypothetical protein
MEQAVIDNGPDRAKAPAGSLDRYFDPIPKDIAADDGLLMTFMHGVCP